MFKYTDKIPQGSLISYELPPPSILHVLQKVAHRLSSNITLLW